MTTEQQKKAMNEALKERIKANEDATKNLVPVQGLNESKTIKK